MRAFFAPDTGLALPVVKHVQRLYDVCGQFRSNELPLPGQWCVMDMALTFLLPYEDNIVSGR